MNQLTKVFAGAAILASLAGGAQATTYSNLPSTGSYWGIGAPWGGATGQAFHGVSGVLQDFTFYAASGDAGNLQLVIADWSNGQTKAVGPALYTSMPIAYSGGQQALTASGINLTLQAGHDYVAYLQMGNVANPTPFVAVKYTWGDDGGLGGNAFYRLSGNDPLDTPQYSWSWLCDECSFTYTANISAVPEPASYGMLIGGLALLGALVRRKENSVAV